MNEEQESGQNKNSAGPSVDESDYLLQLLVSQVNQIQGLQIGITLHVSGITISGLLIGGGEYFDSFAEQFANGFSEEEVRSSYRELFATAGSVYKEEPNESSPPVRYLHLRDAKFYSATTPVVSIGSLWRGRISEVSGFTLGQITSAPRPTE